MASWADSDKEFEQQYGFICVHGELSSECCAERLVPLHAPRPYEYQPHDEALD